MIIRHATYADIPQMQEILHEAKQKMRASGNMNQWTNGYPSDEVLRRDIERGFSHVVESDERVVGTFVLALSEEPTYKMIYEGAWMDDTLPYGTIHRIGSREGVHGIMQAVVDWALTQTDNIRIDTHRDNAPMRHIVEKLGFCYCGVIYLADGSERVAYQKIIHRNEQNNKTI